MRLELVCPTCETPARPVLIEPPPEDYTCEGCHETFPREQLKQRRVLHRQIAGAKRGDVIPVAVDFLGSVTADTPGSGTIALAGVSVGAGERIYAAYLADYTIVPTRSTAATWGSAQVGASPWVVDNVTREASLDTDGIAQLWTITFDPPVSGSRTLSVTESGTVPDHRILAAFRVRHANSHEPGAETEIEDKFAPPTTIGPLGAAVNAWLVACGAQTTTLGTWAPLQRLQRITNATMFLDIALSNNPILSGSISGFTAANHALSGVGYRNAGS